MKILFVDASRNGWGTEQHLVSLAGALAESGHAVSAVVKRGSPVARLLLERGVRTYATAFRGGADPRGVLTMINAIRRDAPDWVVTNRAKLYWTVWPEAFVPGESGLLVEPHDDGELRDAIRRLYDDRVLCAHFAAAGKRYARSNFASRRIADQFVAALGTQRAGSYASHPLTRRSRAVRASL